MRTKLKIAAPLAALAILAGCTTATPYQPLGSTRTQGGYVDQQLDATHYRVSFFGNSLTSRQQVENYLLYRAAELTLARGFNCFTVVNHGTDRQTTIQTRPYGGFGGYGGFGYGGYYPGWSPYWSMHGPYGWYNYDPFFGGPFSRYDIDTIDRYQAMADIALSKGQCQTTPGTFNAAEVVQNLRPYIVYPQPRRY
jgi:hypothetical protein